MAGFVPFMMAVRGAWPTFPVARGMQNRCIDQHNIQPFMAKLPHSENASTAARVAGMMV
jgi:hypothetical protein